MLTLEVIPERCLGCIDQWEFILGMHFSQAVAIVQSQLGIIKGVQVLYSEKKPLEADLVINLPHDGIRLFFDPITQRLKIIEIYSMKSVKLKYCGLDFNSPEILPSVEQIEHSFGATHPGVYDSEKKMFMLNFRGLSFYFPVESEFQTGSSHNLGSLQFQAGNSPIVSRLAIYSGFWDDQFPTPELPLTCYHGQIYLKKAIVLRGRSYTRGLKLHLMASSSTRLSDAVSQEFEREILLGQSTQEISTALGAPSKVFYKSEDKMKIHSPNPDRKITAIRSDYFFNYFTLGMDILFDANTNTAKKIVLHTNYPGHYNFNMYMRCEFNLTLNDIDIDAYTHWDDICKKLTPSDRPVVLNRASSTNTTNPFGSTLCYGYQDIIFEVMPNHYIASLTLYGDGIPYEKENSQA
ncbi:PHAF1 protein CG7083 isoform X2 [Diorhabda carinulata]|uniref:PHAF1 protein CG7083 isoform X2 n=1 Tax=Diorhabda carinulata TaxID=1163345 RepID=UPI0025A2E06E|nr:PHAF1 protein CG7083 isoform X2 [Diorhabda carinulata]